MYLLGGERFQFFCRRLESIRLLFQALCWRVDGCVDATVLLSLLRGERTTGMIRVTVRPWRTLDTTYVRRCQWGCIIYLVPRL